MRKFLSLCIAIALTTSLIPVQAVSQGMPKNKIKTYSENDVKVLADEGDTNVELSPWQFFQTGTSTQDWNPDEVCAFSKIVTSENEILGKSNFSYTSSGNTHYYDDKTIKTTKSANGFSATIENNGWSAQYDGGRLSENNPYTLVASTEVNFKEGNIYQISFDASIDDDARCEVEGEALDSPNRFASTNVKYAQFSIWDDFSKWEGQLSKTLSITKKQKRYTYEYNAYYDSNRKLKLELGAFLYRNEYVLTKEANWSGTVNISNFSVKKIGDLNIDKPTTKETTEEPTIEETTAIDYSAGDNAYYSFDEYTGVLTINGTGKVNKVVPEQLSEKVKKAVVSEGITEIGEINESEGVIFQPGIFDGCVNMTDVSLPTTLKSIGRWAFAYCTSLKSLTIPKNVTSIKKEALKACTSLEKLTVLNANLAILNTDVPATTTIYANLNSRAKSYCDMSGNPFVAIDETTPQVTTPQVTTAKPTDVIVEDATWGSYFGYNEGWYEGAEGKLLSQTESGWVAKLDTIGWGGCWGAQIYQDANEEYGTINVQKGSQYKISFELLSIDCDKWVYFTVGSAGESDKGAFSQWIKLKKGEKFLYSKTFVAKHNAKGISFGIGGEFGDSLLGDSTYRYGLLDETPKDGDSLDSTTIVCNNFSLVNDSQTSETTTSKDLQISEPLTPIIQVNGNTVSVIVRNDQEQNKLGILYNIYLDGNIIYSSVNSGSYTIKNISSGDHIVKVTSVLNGQMSKGVEVGVRVDKVEKTTTKKSIKINVAKASIKNAKNIKKKKIKLTLKKIGGVNGYEIQYSTDSKFSGVKKKVTKKTDYVISKLKKNKKYFVRVRAFKYVSGKKYCGKWSNAKKIKISK